MTPTEEHPRAQVAMTFGVLGLVLGIVTFGAGLLLSPIAWWVGDRTLREMDAQPDVVWSNRGQTQTAVWLGTIGTAILMTAAALGAAFLAVYWSGALRMN